MHLAKDSEPHSSRMMVQSPLLPKLSHPQSSVMQTMRGNYSPASLEQNVSGSYVFGRHFTIESDHKSLEQISMKNLADAPVRLQRMLLRLQDYDFTIKYRPGGEMVVADTLSRYSPEDTPEILLDISVNHMYTSMLRRNKTTNSQSRMTHC